MLFVPRKMRKEFVTAIVVLILAGCHEVNEPATKIEIASGKSVSQLLFGFYQLENNQWRWTARQFAAALKPPEGAEQRGATLNLTLYLSDAQIHTLGPMTLSASAGDYPLDPQTFLSSGTYVYSREIPRPALATSLLPLNFSFDKATSPFSGDGRELAAIVTTIELQKD